MTSSVGMMIIPNIWMTFPTEWKVIKNMFQTTNQIVVLWIPETNSFQCWMDQEVRTIIKDHTTMCQPRITVLKCIKYDFGKLATHGHSSW